MDLNTVLNESVHPLLTDSIRCVLANKKIVNIYDFVEAEIKLLTNITQISFKNICKIKEVIIKKKSANAKTGLELYNELLNEFKKIPSEIKELDKLLDGGFHSGNIYELCGESLSGKTLLCYNIISNISENEKIYYMDAKINFSTVYMKFLFKSQKRSKDFINTKLSNILIQSIFSLNQLLLALYNIKKELENGLQLRFIVINSLSSIYYTEETEYAYSMMNLITNILRVLTNDFHIVVFVINLISTWTEGHFNEKFITKDKLSCGNYWRNVPNVRFKIIKDELAVNTFKIIILKSSVLAENETCNISLPLCPFKNINIQFY